MEIRCNDALLISIVAPILLFVVSHATNMNAVMSLSVSNYHKETQGKVVFIKFFAPWCGHCKAMASDWEKLAESYKTNDKNILIAEVDCTADDNNELCQDVGVQGYPTLMYGDSTDLDKYEGARDYKSLEAFAKEHLKPQCSLKGLELCSEKDKAAILEAKAMTTEERATAISKAKDSLEKAEEEYMEEEDKIQDMYDAKVGEHEAKLRRIKKDNNMRLLKLIRKMKLEAEEGLGEGEL